MNKLIESVLMVEDDAALREALLDTLRSAGITAVGASDAATALQTLETEEIALIISDVQMPGPNGYELLSSIKRLRPDLPVVLMTAYGTVAQAVAAMREGATDYIVKPFDAKSLIDMAPTCGASGTQRTRRGGPRVEARDQPRAQDCGKRCHRAHHRRKRHRQGSVRALHSR
jgi:two-component system response regulator FlrC